MKVQPARAIDKDLVAKNKSDEPVYFCNVRCKQRFVDGVIDPICGMSIDVERARERALFAPAQREQDKGTQFFCCAKCAA